MIPKNIQSQLSNPTNKVSQHLIQFWNLPTSHLVVRTVVAREPRKVLELGFLRGSTLKRIAKALPQAQIAGLEISQINLAAAQTNLSQTDHEGRLNLQLYSDGEVMPFKDRSFDLVFAVHVSYFWDDIDHELSEIYRVLEPDGEIMLVTMPRKRLRVYQGDTFSKQSLEHIRATLIKAGFDPKSIKQDVRTAFWNGKVEILSAKKI